MRNSTPWIAKEHRPICILQDPKPCICCDVTLRTWIQFLAIAKMKLEDTLFGIWWEFKPWTWYSPNGWAIKCQKSVPNMVEARGYIQAFCNHLNPVISSLKDEQYSQEGSQYHFHAVTILLMMTSGQCHLEVLIICHNLKNQAWRGGLHYQLFGRNSRSLHKLSCKVWSPTK